MMVVAMAFGMVHAACAPVAATEPAGRLQAVSVVTAQVGAVADRVRLTGSVVAGELVSVKSGIQGLRIISVEAEAGDTVEAGEILVRLDDTMLRVEEAGARARLARADAAVAQARVKVEDAVITRDQSRSERARSGKLQERGFVAQDTIEMRTTSLKRAETDLASTRLAVTLAEADRRIIETDMSRIAAEIEMTRIRAPTAGRLLERRANVGDFAASTGEALFTMARNGSLELDADVSERQFAQLRIGQKVAVTIAGQDAALRGTVRLLQPVLAAESRLGRLRVTLPTDAVVPVGTFARGDVEVARREGVFLPASAVQIGENRSYVLAIHNDVVARLPIVAGLRASGLVEIQQGVSVGTSVVLKAASFLADGDRVVSVEAPYSILPYPTDNTLLTLASER